MISGKTRLAFLAFLIATLFVASCGVPAVRLASLPGSRGMPVSQSGTASPHVSQTGTPVSTEAVQPGLLTQLPASADPAQGNQIFHTFQPLAGMACATCHRTDSEVRLIGPGLLNIGGRAAARVKGLNAVAYIYQSIVDPSAYVVAGYVDLMPKNWAKALSQEQIEDVIAYLLTLK